MNPVVRAIAVLLVTTLAGCAHLASPISASDDQKLVLEVIAQAHRVGQLPADDQHRELLAASQSFAREKTMATRLRYGVFLALPSVPGNDETRAAGVLEPLTMAGSPAVRQFAAIVLGQVNDRLREERRSQQLKEQLDELMAIERNLIERNPPKK